MPTTLTTTHHPPDSQDDDKWTTLEVELAVVDHRQPCQWLDASCEAVDVWLPALGPTAAVLMSRLARSGPGVWQVDDLRLALGKVSRSTLQHALSRLAARKLIGRDASGGVIVYVSSHWPRKAVTW